MKNKILKYIGIVILVLVLLVGVALALLPVVVKQQASKYYAQAVPEGVLTIEDVGINVFTGKLLLNGVNASSQQDNVLKLGKFNVELSLKDLLSKSITLHTLTLSDFDVLIEREDNQIWVAGYALPNESSEVETDEQKEPLSLKSLGIEQLDIHTIELKNIHATLKGKYIASDGVVKSLTLKNIHSNNTQPATLNADIQLNTLALKKTAQSPISAHLKQPATLNIEATIQNLFDAPEAQIRSELKIKDLNFEDDAQHIHINKPIALTLNANVKNAVSDPSSYFDLTLNAPSVRYTQGAQNVNAGVNDLKIKGDVKNILQSVAVRADVDVHKLNWDVQLNKEQSFTGASEVIAIPKLSIALGDKRQQTWLKGLPLSTLSFAGLKVSQLQSKTTLPSLVSDVTLNTLSVDGFDVLNPESSSDIKADFLLNALEYDLGEKNKRISLSPNAKLALQAKIEKLNALTAKADAQLSQFIVNAEGFNKPLVSLDELKINRFKFQNVKTPQVNIQDVALNQMAFMGEGQPLLKLSSKVQGVALQGNKLVINDVALNDMSSNVTFSPKYKVAKVEKLLSYFSSTNSSKAVPPQSQTPSEFKAVIKRVHTTGQGVVRIKDAALQPAINHELLLKKIDIKNINTSNTQAATAFDVDVRIGKYSHVDLAGDYTLLAKKPTGKFKGKLDNIDLLNYNTYLAQAIGYKAKTGALSLDVDVAVTQAELSGGVDVLLNNLELNPSNTDRVESLKKQLSMPLDQSLDLLKDKEGKIQINLPLSGNINSPDFSLSGVMTLVTKKALKAATMMGLKQMIQPYGSLLTIGEWAGDKLLAVKLDPIEYGYGETQVAQEKIPYLDKVVEIMKEKEALNLKLCSKISKEEAEFAMLKPEELLPIANERSESVRAYLIEKGGLPAGRILQCESEVADKTKPYSWLDLEI